MKTYTFEATLEADDDGRWSAWLSSYPACGAWGDTRSEALLALADMTVVFLEEMSDAGEPVHADSVEPHEDGSPARGGIVDLGGDELNGGAMVNNGSILIPVSA